MNPFSTEKYVFSQCILFSRAHLYTFMYILYSHSIRSQINLHQLARTVTRTRRFESVVTFYIRAYGYKGKHVHDEKRWRNLGRNVESQRVLRACRGDSRIRMALCGLL